MTGPPTPAPEPGDGEAPAYGYEVPPLAYGAPDDPLVTPATEGFNGWYRRLFATLRRSWRSLVLISLTTYAGPVAAVSVLLSLASRDMVVTVPAADGTTRTSLDTGVLGVLALGGLGAILVTSLLTSVGNAAAVWSLTREAAGRAAPLGGALAFGIREGFRLWGWSLLYTLIVLVGICACVLPGLYFALAGSLYIPLTLYVRSGNPIGLSFALVNRNLGAALGRMVLLVLMVYGVELALSIPLGFVRAASPTAGLVAELAVQVVTAPLALVLTLGSVLLFAELWAKQVATTTGNLDAALAA
jgi:hypothetical protein